MRKFPANWRLPDSSPWILAILTLALLLVAVALKGTGLGWRPATVTVDKTGTARVGGLVPLRNKNLRDTALPIFWQMNSTNICVVADRDTEISNIVEVLDSLSKGRPPKPRF
jgi:hypothetical protein